MSNSADLRFLVVDDFSTMRHIIRVLLKELGYTHVEEAEDGVVALGMLRLYSPFNFVISDVDMPNMNGLELLQAIKADEALKHLPVLLVTAEASKADRVLAAQNGAAGCIVKPLTGPTLWSNIQQALGKPVTWR